METIYRSLDMNVSVDAQKRIISGRAVSFNTPSSKIKDSADGPVYREVIAPGAFTRSLTEGKDILSFKEHNKQMLLGRTSSGTLNVRQEQDGLYVDINVPETTFGNDLLVQANRGDIKAFSFGYRPVKSRAYKQDGENIVERQVVDLIEVSPVAMPAYENTTLYVRSASEIWEAEETKPEQKQDNTAACINQKQVWANFIITKN